MSKFFSGDPPSVTVVAQALATVAQTLATHDGRAASLRLAFDLVLNDIVEQARDTTGATGAAIALVRDGDVVCRATTGNSAPDLGVRIDTASGLAGMCVSSGQIQQCSDTETDARVNPEACRRLGVRSMLIVPLIDAETVFGILQAFSARPNAFREHEVSALLALAGRITESKRESETDVLLTPRMQEGADALPRTPTENVTGPSEQPIYPSQESSHPATPLDVDAPKRHEIWSAILVLLVIGAATVLGLAVGWHGASKELRGASPAMAPIASSTTSDTTPTARPEYRPTPSNSPAISDVRSTPAATISARADSKQTVGGGLVITENGKVIYRSPPSGKTVAARTLPAHTSNRPIHRVELKYPQQARDQKIQGAVVLLVKIEGDGSVGDIGVASGDPVLAQAASQAVKQWRYQRYFVDGHPVERQARITVWFRLPSS